MHHLSRATSTRLAGRRALELLGMCMIGDGLLALIEPRRHVELWRTDVRPIRAMVEPFADRPQLTRWAGAAGMLLGFWLASRQQP